MQPDKAQKRKFKKMKQMITEKLQNIKDEEVSDSEQVDLSIELHPIKHYIDDKEEMIEQMFASLGPTLIQNMLPPLLKNVPLNELKADCLIQLLGMSKKRIFTSIEGKELQSSSESEFDSDGSSSSEKRSVNLKKVTVQPKAAKRKYIIDADTLNVSIDGEDDLDNLSLSNGETSRTSRKRKSLEKMKKSKQKQPKRVENGVAEIEGASPISISSNEGSDAEKESKSVAPKKGQTLLEILELEMRAKAIRSLLKQGTSGSSQPGKESETESSLFDPNIKIKPEPKEPEPDPDIIEIIEPPPPEPIVVDSADESEKPESDSETSKTTSLTHNATQEAGKSKATPDKEDAVTTAATSIATNNAEKSDPKAQGTSWSERYLENKETEKLIKTSKMCTNIRKRMRLVRSMQQRQQVKEKVEIPVVIGSISEYQQLVGNDSSSNSLKSVGEGEVPETNEPEAPSHATPEVPAATESSGSPTPNLQKTDLICSDILEIDVSIADLDPDNSSNPASKSKKNEDLREPVLNLINDLRSKGVDLCSEVTGERVTQNDDKVTEVNKNDGEMKDSTSREGDKEIEACLNDQDGCQIDDGRKMDEPSKNENLNNEEVSQNTDVTEEQARQSSDGSDNETNQSDSEEEKEVNEQEVIHINLIENEVNEEVEKVNQTHSEESSVAGTSRKEGGSNVVDEEREEGEIEDSEEPEKIVTPKKSGRQEKEKAKKKTKQNKQIENLDSDIIVLSD